MAYLDTTGLTYFYQKIKAIFTRRQALTVTLSSTGWSLNGDYYYQTITVSGLTTTTDVIINSVGNVIATAQNTNSITFRSDSLPGSNLSINIMILI